jgi:hypothetical protein
MREARALMGAIIAEQRIMKKSVCIANILVGLVVEGDRQLQNLMEADKKPFFRG